MRTLIGWKGDLKNLRDYVFNDSQWWLLYRSLRQEVSGGKNRLPPLSAPTPSLTGGMVVEYHRRGRGDQHTHTHLTHITHTQHTHTGKRVRSKVMQHASSRPIQVERIMLTIKIISIYSIRKGKNQSFRIIIIVVALKYLLVFQLPAMLPWRNTVLFILILFC